MARRLTWIDALAAVARSWKRLDRGARGQIGRAKRRRRRTWDDWTADEERLRFPRVADTEAGAGNSSKNTKKADGIPAGICLDQAERIPRTIAFTVLGFYADVPGGCHPRRRPARPSGSAGFKGNPADVLGSAVYLRFAVNRGLHVPFFPGVYSTPRALEYDARIRHQRGGRHTGCCCLWKWRRLVFRHSLLRLEA